MIESIGGDSGNTILLRYFGILAQAGKRALLNTRLNSKDYYTYGRNEEEDFNEKYIRAASTLKVFFYHW